jgi:hypothetical protein
MLSSEALFDARIASARYSWQTNVVMTREELAARRVVYNRRWRAKYHAELLEKEKLWREARREELRARSKAWRLTHHDKSIAWGRTAYQAKRDELVAKKRLYNAERKDEINAKSRARYAVNHEKKRAYAAIYRATNKAILRAKDKAYQKANPDKVAARSRKHIAARLNAMPPWADEKAIKAIYAEAARMTRETGIPHDVDHIYPLQGRTVCGLHVAANLQVITHSENCRKRNSHPDF